MEQGNFNKLGNIQAAMDTLRMYNSYVLFPATEDMLQIPELEVYFNSPLDDPIERKVEKMVCVAAIRAVYQNPDIPQMNKERAAKATARGLRASMQLAKLEYYASTHEMKVEEYNRRKRSNYIVRKATRVKMAKRLVKNFSITAFAGLVAGPIGAGVAVGTRILWGFLPEKIKRPIERRINEYKEKAYNVLRNTVTVVKNKYEVFKSTEVGQKVEKSLNAVKPYVAKAVDVVVKVATKAKNFIKSFFPF